MRSTSSRAPAASRTPPVPAGPIVATGAGPWPADLRAILHADGLPTVDDDGDVELVRAPLAGAEDLRALEARLVPGRRVVAVVPAVHRPTLHRAVLAGLLGCVLEARAAATLAATVRAVACGQVVLPHEHFDEQPAPVFSAREKQVLGMVVLGFTNGEIARKLFLAESTIKSHLGTAFAKLGVRNRQEAAAMVLDPANGLRSGIIGLSEPGA